MLLESPYDRERTPVICALSFLVLGNRAIVRDRLSSLWIEQLLDALYSLVATCRDIVVLGLVHFSVRRVADDLIACR